MKEKSKEAIKILSKLKKLSHDNLRLAAEWNKPWQSLISTILSAQTRDDTTIKISNILYKKYSTIDKLAKAKIRDVKKIIKPVNFHKTKAKHIIATAKILKDKYKGKVPHDKEKLLKLPGVGRKTANVFLATQNKPAIGVDTHVSFLSQKLGWTKHKTQRKIEQDLEKLFPKSYWRSINYILVRFGRTHSRKKQIEIIKKLKRR